VKDTNQTRERVLRTWKTSMVGFVVVASLAGCTTAGGSGKTTSTDSVTNSVVTLDPPVSTHQTETRPLTGPDMSQLIADCLRDEGFHVRMEGTALVTEVPPEQEEVFNAAVDDCTLRYFPPQGSDLPSGEDLEARYEHLLQAGECVSGAGYEVPTPPTVESFVDSGGTNWDPFDLLQPPFDISLEDYQALDARCNPPLAP
jgi:hypothetical protein